MKFWIAVLILLGGAFNASAEVDKDDEKTKKSFVTAPLVMSSPSFGNGAGVTCLYFYQPTPENDTSPPSHVSATGAYSDTDSYFIGVFNKNFLNNDSWRPVIGGVTGHIENELDIDDIGTAEFSSDIIAVFARSDWRVIGDWFLGVKGSYADISYKTGNEESREYFETYDVKDNASASFGMLASYDTRDNTRYPYKGIFAELGLTFVPEFLGSEESYHVLDSQINVYKLVFPKQVLALRAYGRFTPSDTPYSGLSTLGRRSDLRGYTSGEHMAENLISTQAEYRWMIFKKFGIVGFVGAAALYDKDISNINSDTIFVSGGIGFRYVLHEENRVNFRVDFAFGENDDDGFYVSIKEAF